MYVAITMQVELSSTNYTTNNSAVLLDEIGENSNPLVCRIDLSPCCRASRKGDWFYPNGTRVLYIYSENFGYLFHRSRDDEMRVFLWRLPGTLSPMGSYCCQVLIPTVAQNESFCVFLSKSYMLTLNR